MNVCDIAQEMVIELTQQEVDEEVSAHRMNWWEDNNRQSSGSKVTACARTSLKTLFAVDSPHNWNPYHVSK